MPSYILVSEEEKIDDFISNFKKEHRIKDIDTTIYSDKLLIDHTRSIIKSLSLKSSSPKLLVLRNEITIEAQNALLKNIEELSSWFTIIICTTTLSALLPTIHSRSFIINSSNNSYEEGNLHEDIYLYTEQKIGLWELIDRLEEKGVKEPLTIMTSLRKLMLDPDTSQRRQIFIFLKKLLALSPLIEKNNINFKIALEKSFTV